MSVAAARRGRDGDGAGEGCGQGGRTTSSAAARGDRPALPARLRAPALEAAGSGVCGADIPRPRRRKSLCQEPARRSLPLRPGVRRAAANSEPRAPRPAPGRMLREGSSAGAGRKREMKEKQRGRWAFLLFVRIC